MADLPDPVLMELLAEFTSWQNYAAAQLAEAEVTEARADAHVRLLEAQGMVATNIRATVTQSKAVIAVDPEVERAKGVALEAYARRKMTKVVYENCERNVFVISRELSRRIGSSPIERRNMRWNP